MESLHRAHHCNLTAVVDLSITMSYFSLWLHFFIPVVYNLHSQFNPLLLFSITITEQARLWVWPTPKSWCHLLSDQGENEKYDTLLWKLQKFLFADIQNPHLFFLLLCTVVHIVCYWWTMECPWMQDESNFWKRFTGRETVGILMLYTRIMISLK